MDARAGGAAMVRLLVVRHAMSEANGVRLAGRLPGVPLTAEGLEQADRLAERLALFAPAAIYSSPLDRAVATVSPLAIRLGLAIELDHGLHEIDFGEWSGKTFAELAPLRAWQIFNETPGRAAIPGGESLVMAGSRALQAITRIAHAHPGQTVVIASHGDLIRLLLARVLGMPLDAYRRLRVEPGACCELQVDEPHPITVTLDVAPDDRLEEFPHPEVPFHAGRHHHVTTSH